VETSRTERMSECRGGKIKKNKSLYISITFEQTTTPGAYILFEPLVWHKTGPLRRAQYSPSQATTIRH
jgi:hypothetical protein